MSLPTDFESDLPRKLQIALSRRDLLPAPTVAPALSYGRHRGPFRTTARIAAVAVTLYQQDDGQWIVPLTLRPRTLKHHGGQVCLPGGRLEPGEDAYAGAMREFHEELGLAAEVIQRCGELSTQYVYASNNLVHPVVSIIRAPQRPWKPDPVEVAEVIALPLSTLMDARNRAELTLRRPVRSAGRQVDDLVFSAAAFEQREHRIWGATALILDQLAQVLRS